MKEKRQHFYWLKEVSIDTLREESIQIWKYERTNGREYQRNLLIDFKRTAWVEPWSNYERGLPVQQERLSVEERSTRLPVLRDRPYQRQEDGIQRSPRDDTKISRVGNLTVTLSTI